MTSKIGVKKIQYPNGTDILTLDSSGSLAITSDLTVDTNTLHVDASNNRVGIGTTSPDQPLHIQSSGDAQAIMKTSGATNYSMSIYENSADNIHNWGVGRWHDGRFVISHKNSTGSWSNAGVNERFVIETTQGAVTMPAQPGFLAKISGSYPDMNIATVPFNHAVFNNGGHYNTSNYRFTAPIAGNYYLSYSVRVNHTTSGHIIHPCFQINGSNDATSLTIHKNDTTGQYMHTSFSYVRNLSASDYVTVTMSNGTNGGGTMQDNQCSFSGFLAF